MFSECKHTKMDVGFLVDSSGSINVAHRNNYQRMKDFMKRFVKSVEFGQNKTQISIATFSSQGNFKIRINFTAYSTTDSLVSAAQNIPYDAGGTAYTGEALNSTNSDLFTMARDGVPKILIVLTDSQSQDSVTSPSSRLQGTGVHIISVGVGDAVYAELADMASPPKKDNVFNVTFYSLVNLVGPLVEAVCKGK